MASIPFAVAVALSLYLPSTLVSAGTVFEVSHELLRNGQACKSAGCPEEAEDAEVQLLQFSRAHSSGRTTACDPTVTCCGPQTNETLCNTQDKCYGMSSCCHASGTCQTSTDLVCEQANDCESTCGDTTSPTSNGIMGFPPAADRKALNHNEGVDDGCFCNTGSATNPEEDCQMRVDQKCWGKTDCNSTNCDASNQAGCCSDTGLCSQNKNFGFPLGGLCVFNGMSETFKFCGGVGTAPPPLPCPKTCFCSCCFNKPVYHRRLPRYHRRFLRHTSLLASSLAQAKSREPSDNGTCSNVVINGTVNITCQCCQKLASVIEQVHRGAYFVALDCPLELQ